MMILLMAFPAAAAPVLEGIELADDPFRIALRFDSEVRWRVFQTGPKELVVALQDTSVARDLARSGSGLSLIERIVYKRSADGNATLIVETKAVIRAVDTRWRSGVRVLEVFLYPEVVLTHKTPRSSLEKRRRADTALVTRRPEIEREKRVEPATGSIRTEEIFDLEGYGGIDTLLDAVLASSCGGGVHVRVAVRSMREGNCEQALDTLAQGLMEDCGYVYAYLDAWCRFQRVKRPSEMLALARELVSLVVKEPESEFLPWAYAMLGVLYHRMGNDPLGMGYFELLREESPDFPGIPEILLYLGRMYVNIHRLEEAEPLLRDLVERFGHTVFALDARMELGRVLFERKRYFDTLAMLETLIRETPDRVFADADLLLLVGNSHFHTGNYKKALEALVRAYNDFPEMAEPSLVLTRIAESYAALNEKEKAKKLYELVREMYPGTDGFVVSSIRLAEMLEDREEKDALFEMVIRDYPDHPLARLALMRLAESRYEAGKYSETVDLIRRLLAADPRALRRNALLLMGRGLQALFGEYLEAGLYPEVIRRYEREKGPLYEMEKPELHAQVGKAFLEGHLYPQALRHYERAEKLWGGEKIPPEVRYEYAWASMETGDGERALAQFRIFLKEVPRDSLASAEALGAVGRIQLEKGNDTAALQAYRDAAGLAANGVRKAFFLMAASKIVREKGDRVAETDFLERALAFLNRESEDSPDLRFEILRSLGESRSAQNHFAGAEKVYREAEAMAARPAGERNAVRFRLAETLEKTGNMGEAERLYEILVEDADPLWGSMARERLAGMRIETRLRDS
ncbi:tetratricopeptide repeat protein [Desulfobotulus sp. H1]|uniref:Tetratricopeptide repeat protein n=1 Tax=Desulfobotulus pelophilus TaxID=2823377 RepID=A0ABT3N8P5_9BACT|nr:tetratricopeptide repeat protein [Desulfobotulus pelophilus]MCW7753828.1 tetratricopeptide repeat protein [Desulfobotulus pelophilus]